MTLYFRALSCRESREPSGAHWCPPELVQYGWGHYTSQQASPQASLSLHSNQVQPAPLGQTEQTEDREERGESEDQSSGQQSEETEKTGESLDPEMMVTLCESPHRFLATLDDDLSLDLPSVPM